MVLFVSVKKGMVSKMKKIILTSVMAILSLSVNVMAAKPNVMNDTMSYRNMADLKDSGGWKVVGSTNTIVDQQYAKLIMENDGTSVCDNGIIKEFSSYLSGYATIEFVLCNKAKNQIAE